MQAKQLAENPTFNSEKKIMSVKLWPTVTAQSRCPICGKSDWCALGDYAVKCMREPSDHPSTDGGWYHPYQGGVTNRPFNPPKRDVAPPLENAFKLVIDWHACATESRLFNFARMLGVGSNSLDWLMVGWSEHYQAWSFPMYDGESKIVGIRLRNEQGDKWAVKGSRQGLFIPSYFEGDDKWHDMCFVTEGPTDCAAVLSLGLYSIGRPSCNANADQLRIALKQHGIRRVVIVSDNDDKRRADGRQWSPGIDGAKALGSAIKIPHVIWIPPTKDVRDFVRQGGTKQMILDGIKNQVWKR